MHLRAKGDEQHQHRGDGDHDEVEQGYARGARQCYVLEVHRLDQVHDQRPVDHPVGDVPVGVVLEQDKQRAGQRQVDERLFEGHPVDGFGAVIDAFPQEEDQRHIEQVAQERKEKAEPVDDPGDKDALDHA